MWELRNKTPFATDQAVLLDATGRHVWVAAVRATFDIAEDGALQLADTQQAVRQTDEYFGEPHTSALKYPNDLVLKKAGTDVMVHGHAYAPHGRSLDSVEVGVQVAGWQKTVRVYGERLWYKSLLSLRHTDPKPFSTMPLHYDRAWGGVDPRTERDAKTDMSWSPYNPIGKGFAQDAKSLADTLMPNLEVPGQPVAPGPELRLPAGFGPIAPHWGQRQRYCGTYDAQWRRERMPLLPADFDVRFFRCAPPDQQFSRFLGGKERVVLHHLTPAGRLEFALPDVRIAVVTDIEGKRQELEANLHTVIIEPDHPRVQLVWHARVPRDGALFSYADISWTGDDAWL